MKFVAAVILFFVAAFTSGAGQLVTAAQSTLLSQSPFFAAPSTVYYFEGAAFARMPIGMSNITVTVPMTNVAGSYRVFIRSVVVYSKKPYTVKIGDAVSLLSPTTLQSYTWAGSDDVMTSTIGITNLSITLTNANYTTNVNDIHIAEVYMAPATNESFIASPQIGNSGNIFADYNIPTTTNLTDIVSGNLLQNSSFEFGPLGGWSSLRDGTLKDGGVWLRDQIDTSQFHSGSRSMRMNGMGAYYQVVSPVFRLRGTNVWRPYTLSIWAKAEGSQSLVVGVFPVVTPVDGRPYTNSVSIPLGSLTSSWTRKTSTIFLCPVPSREFYLTISSGNLTDRLWLDDLKFEEGTTATAWSPPDPIEVGVTTERNGAYFFQGDTPKLNAVAYNSGTNAAIVINTQVYNFMNELVTNLVTSFIATNGYNERVIFPPAIPGAYRLVTTLEGHSGYAATESNYSVLAWEKNTLALNQNSWMGTHVSGQWSAVATNRDLGIDWVRSLSTAHFARMEHIVAVSNVYVWDSADYMVSNLTSARVLGAFGDIKPGSAPSWVMQGGVPRTNDLTVFTSNVVTRYKGTVTDWELINEPTANTGYSDATVASLSDSMILGIRGADPTAKIVAGGGIASPITWSNIWNSMSSATKAMVGTVSYHYYPSYAGGSASGGFDLNDPEAYGVIRDSKTLGVAQGLNVWNSESGMWKAGHKHIAGGWISDGVYLFPNIFEETFARSHVASPYTLMRQVLRSVGNGLKFFQYDDRISMSYNYARIDAQPTLYDYDDTLSIDGVAYYHAASLINRGIPLGWATNLVTGTNVESYAYAGNAGQAVIAAWTYNPMTNVVLTLSTPDFEVRNIVGRQISTNVAQVRISKLPVYLISGTLGTNALISAFINAAASWNQDTNAPNVSIDVYPEGSITSAHLPLRFKWTSVDENRLNSMKFQTNVVTRHKITGIDADWSPWDNTRLRMIPTLPAPGVFQFIVQTKDAVGKATNEAQSRLFFVNAPLAAASTFNVGTVNVTP